MTEKYTDYVVEKNVVDFPWEFPSIAHACIKRFIISENETDADPVKEDVTLLTSFLIAKYEEDIDENEDLSILRGIVNRHFDVEEFIPIMMLDNYVFAENTDANNKVRMLLEATSSLVSELVSHYPEGAIALFLRSEEDKLFKEYIKDHNLADELNVSSAHGGETKGATAEGVGLYIYVVDSNNCLNCQENRERIYGEDEEDDERVSRFLN